MIHHIPHEQLCAIVAATPTNGIGFDGKIPWRIPADLRLFKQRTLHQPVIMGRVTYESLPPSVRPLPDRLNIVLSRSAKRPTVYPEPEGTQLFHRADLHSARHLANKLLDRCPTREVFVIGGAEIYQEAWPYLERIYLTRVHPDHPTPTDRNIPAIEPEHWVERCAIDAAIEKTRWSYHEFIRRRPPRAITG